MHLFRLDRRGVFFIRSRKYDLIGLLLHRTVCAVNHEVVIGLPSHDIPAVL